MTRVGSVYREVEFVSAAEWRAWLAANHEVLDGVWCVTYKKAEGHRYLAYEDVVWHAVCCGWIDGRKERVDAARSKMLITKRKPKSGWSASDKLGSSRSRPRG